ncbi:MAG: ABC transporter ATP-binding protein [Nostoc sp. TH1S01]|nr:ABC transporter ATP-binding protein [Nostoc sp. TH1S01]
MSAPIISVCNLNKFFRLYAKPSDRLKEVLFPWRAWHNLFPALQDITFEIEAGEHLGILGVNGAGKSTLLQVLAGVLTPSSGKVDVRGRVASLLELGAGFNPELTGRENVGFQIQLYNLPHSEIQKKLVEVEAFAEIGEFFDQPMKTYSSGMYVRVAFASAILTEPDILIIDEALSVGDARFQKKCYDQLNTLKNRGTTVILVTHDIFGAKTHCSRLLLLHKGRLIANGNPEDVITQYMHILYPSATEQGMSDVEKSGKVEKSPESLLVNENNTNEYILHIDPANATNQWGSGGATLLGMRFFGLLPTNRFINGQKIIIECDYCFDPSLLSALATKQGVVPKLAVGMRVDASNGMPLCDLSSAVQDTEQLKFDIAKEDRATFRFEATLPKLAPGNYFFSPAMSIGDQDCYLPIIVYENAAILQCERTELILGLFKPDYSVQRIS